MAQRLDSYQKVRDWVLKMQGIEREEYDSDEMWEDSDVDDFLANIEWPIFEKHGLDVDFSTTQGNYFPIQGSYGGVFISDKRGKKAYVDYEEYSAEERDIVVDSETEEEYLDRFEDYILSIWDDD